MTMSIDKKITGFSVVTAEEKNTPKVSQETPQLPVADVIQMHERIERPEVLLGSTYKLKSPMVDHAIYVTINDIVLNQGTLHESRRPFEIFVNSKSMEHFQWIVALTRILSAVFRKGGDVAFLVDEMKAVFDPKGGYYKAGGVYMPSVVAELGSVIESHLKSIGMIHDPDMSAAQIQLLLEKRKQFDERNGNVPSSNAGTFPAGASYCEKCSNTSVVILDGCATCLNCGQSKCG